MLRFPRQWSDTESKSGAAPTRWKPPTASTSRLAHVAIQAWHTSSSNATSTTTQSSMTPISGGLRTSPILNIDGTVMVALSEVINGVSPNVYRIHHFKITIIGPQSSHDYMTGGAMAVKPAKSLRAVIRCEVVELIPCVKPVVQITLPYPFELYIDYSLTRTLCINRYKNRCRILYVPTYI